MTKISSVQFSHSVMSNSLWPHEPQHARSLCLSQTPKVYPNSYPLSRLCHLTMSSSVIPVSSCLQSFPKSGSFQMSQLFASGGQNIGVSASTSVLTVKTQDWCALGWTGWISLQTKGLPRVKSINSSVFSFLHSSTLTFHTGKTIVLTKRTFVDKVMSLLFNMLSSLVITFLSRSKRLLISWLQSPSEVILEPPKIKSLTVSSGSPSICCEVMGPDAVICFLNVEF